MNYFKLNIKKLSVELLPTFMRKPIIIAFLLVLTFPLVGIYLAFIKFRKNVNYELSHNGQVCYLRKVLNDKFDPFYRRIEVKDIKIKPPFYIYTLAEKKIKYINTQQEINSGKKPQFIYNDVETNQTCTYDFIILIPTEVYNKEVSIVENKERFYQIEAIVNKYKLVSKQYVIKCKN